MKKAHARHILVGSNAICIELMEDLAKGADFSDVARNFSECPSGHSGGDLGDFFEGDMVKEFNDAVFKGKAGQVIGPVKTQFGHHIIEVISLKDDKE